jgi:hypothetical protein
LHYLDEITSLFEHLTRIVDGMFCQLPQRGKMPLEFSTPFALAIRLSAEATTEVTPAPGVRAGLAAFGDVDNALGLSAGDGQLLPLKLADGTPCTLADGHCADARVSTGEAMAIAPMRSARSRAMTIVKEGEERGRDGAIRRQRRGELRSSRGVVSRLRPGAHRRCAP